MHARHSRCFWKGGLLFRHGIPLLPNFPKVGSGAQTGKRGVLGGKNTSKRKREENEHTSTHVLACLFVFTWLLSCLLSCLLGGRNQNMDSRDEETGDQKAPAQEAFRRMMLREEWKKQAQQPSDGEHVFVHACVRGERDRERQRERDRERQRQRQRERQTDRQIDSQPASQNTHLHNCKPTSTY